MDHTPPPVTPADPTSPEDPVDVVVVTYDSADVVGPLLDSIPDACAGLAHRVVVVDNDSRDDTVRVVRARGDVLLVRAPNLGYAAGVNAGVDALAGRGPVLVLNADVRLSPGSVRLLVEELVAHGHGLVVPRLLDPDGTTLHSLRREPTLLRTTGLGDSRFALLSEVVADDGSYEHPGAVEWATGAAVLVSRACWETLGFMDESFFMYSEETDFFLRAADAGHTASYVPGARVSHVGGASGRSPELHAMQVLNRIRLYRRRHHLLASLAVASLVVGREAVWAARGDADSRRAVAALVSPAARPALLPWRGLLRRSEPERVSVSGAQPPGRTGAPERSSTLPVQVTAAPRTRP